MSNALGIAAVTAVIKDRIHNGYIAAKLSDIMGDITISALPPDKSVNGDTDQNTLNIFLYMVTPNKGWQNIDYPSRNSLGERVNNPPLALDLYYLLMAYGLKDFYAEILLGNAMQILHDTPVFGREIIRKALSPSPPPQNFPTQLIDSNLAEQLEQIKITQQNMNLEDLSKLWTSFQTHYRLTASYIATAVLIQSNVSTKSSLPVINRNLYIIPFNDPVITKIRSSEGDIIPITPLTKLIIEGYNFPTEDFQLEISGIDLTNSVTVKNRSQINLTLPAPLPDGIFPGIQTLKIIRIIEMGTPAVPHGGIESNTEVFIIHPIITVSVESSNPAVINGIPVRNGEIKIIFNPKVNKDQRIILFLNELNPPQTRSAFAYSFEAPVKNGIVDPDTETDNVIFEFKNVRPADYLIRVKVEGAESLLEQNEDENSPEFQKFIKPKVTI